VLSQGAALEGHVLTTAETAHSELSASTFVGHDRCGPLGPPARKRPPRKRVKNSNANENKTIYLADRTRKCRYVRRILHPSCTFLKIIFNFSFFATAWLFCL
jgi:hypothetical protein